jgi:hypothetical protein
LAGISLKPVLKNPKAEVKEAAFSQFGRPYEALFAQSPDYMGYSVRTKNWRCTAWFNLQSDSIEYTELYLLENDKIEKQNHSGDNRFKETESELIRLLWHYKNRAYTTFKDKKINSF